MPMFSAAEVRLLDSLDFLAFCGKWEECRQCSPAFADWLREDHIKLGDEVALAAFEAAMWAVQKERRRCWSSFHPNRRKLSHVCPRYEEGFMEFRWWDIRRNDYDEPYADDVPLEDGCVNCRMNSFAEAIAVYLIRFDHDLAKQYPPGKPKRNAMTR